VLSLRDQELGLSWYSAQHHLSHMQPRESGDPPVVRMVDLDPLHHRYQPAVVVVRRGLEVGIVRGVSAHDEGEELQVPKDAGRDVVRYDGYVHTRALAQDEGGERRLPAGLVRECIAQVEADGHGEVEMVECG